MRDDLGRRRFYRDRRRGKIAGVCAGVADYFGFDVTVTRVLAVIALFVFGPITLFLYFGVVMLVPAADINPVPEQPERAAFRHTLRASPAGRAACAAGTLRDVVAVRARPRDPRALTAWPVIVNSPAAIKGAFFHVQFALLHGRRHCLHRMSVRAGGQLVEDPAQGGRAVGPTR